MKSYDRAYFERWYRHPTDRVSTRESLGRKARMAIAVTEFLIGRRVRTILDVGCGEAPWFPVVRRLRPEASYIGIDSSDYVLEKFGAARNIRRGTLGGLATMRLRRDVDLIVCADVLQYAASSAASHTSRRSRRRIKWKATAPAGTSARRRSIAVSFAMPA
jgi:SAM-dependent methyltransferase